MSNRRIRLRELLEANRWPAIGENELQQLLANLAPISEHYLRRLLRDCGRPLSPLVEGVRQSSLAELERTLGALAEEYVHSSVGRRQHIRSLVITARDRARLASRRPEAARVKPEMILWMSTWLENPSSFPLWVALRKSASGRSPE